MKKEGRKERKEGGRERGGRQRKREKEKSSIEDILKLNQEDGFLYPHDNKPLHDYLVSQKIRVCPESTTEIPPLQATVRKYNLEPPTLLF